MRGGAMAHRMRCEDDLRQRLLQRVPRRISGFRVAAFAAILAAPESTRFDPCNPLRPDPGIDLDSAASLCDDVGSWGESEMKRRNFLAASLASATAAPFAFGQVPQDRTTSPPREYYELRRYHLLTPQRKLADTYFQNALVPGLNRLGISPVGVFNVSIGLEGPSMYVLMPGTSVETLVTADVRLSQDAEYMKAASDFLNAPAKSPAFVRMESSLMV